MTAAMFPTYALARMLMRPTICAARGGRRGGRAVVHLLRDGDAGAVRLPHRRDRVLRRRPRARLADPLEHRRGGRGRSRRPVRPRRDDRDPRRHARRDRDQVRLLRRRAERPSNGRRREGGSRSGWPPSACSCSPSRPRTPAPARWRLRSSRPGTMLDQALWAWGALIVGLGVLPVVIGLAHGRPRGLDTANAVAHRVRLGLRRGRRALHGLRRRQGRLPGRDVRASRLGAEPRLPRPAPVRRRSPSSWRPARSGSGRSRSRLLWPPGRSAPPRSTSARALPGTLRGSPSSRASTPTTSSASTARTGCSTRCSRLSVLVGLAPTLLRRRRLATWIVVGAALLSIGWARRARRSRPRTTRTSSHNSSSGASLSPLGWIDDATGGRPAVYLGQKIADPNGIWSMEFWNRDVRQVWSIDGTAPGPGPTLTPNIYATDGRLRRRPRVRLRRRRHGNLDRRDRRWPREGGLRLVRVARPLRLTESIAGVFSDGWIGSTKAVDSVSADYNRFDAPKQAGNGLCDGVPGGVLRAQGPGSGADRGRHARRSGSSGTASSAASPNGAAGSSTAARERTFPIATPGGPFHVKVTVTPPFQPSALDPRNSERRYFGAQLGNRLRADA